LVKADTYINFILVLLVELSLLFCSSRDIWLQ